VALGDLVATENPLVLENLLRAIRRESRTSLSANCGCWHAPPLSVSAVLTLATGC